MNFAFPIYEQRSDNPLDWSFNTAIGESPALGYVERVGNAVGSALQGDSQNAVKHAYKATPVFGVFTRGVDDAQALGKRRLELL